MNKYIEIKGARVHNLKNIDVKIPRDKLVVITGLSGSGKSTLAFDTVFAEGQRRYVESLSSYARQFLGRIHKPETDSITGIPPAIAIEQKTGGANPRSTVGTTTEIYDYLKLLFARIGRTYSPVSGKEVTVDSVSDAVDYFASRPKGDKILILAPIRDRIIEQITSFVEEGFSRLYVDNETVTINSFLQNYDAQYSQASPFLLIDRLTASSSKETATRVADSLSLAFDRGRGYCSVCVVPPDGVAFMKNFSTVFEDEGMVFEPPSVNMFSFNNPLGACPRCDGYGKITGIDENLVIPDKSLSVFDNAIACWRGDAMNEYRDKLVYAAPKFDFPIHRPYYQLTQKERQLLWTGNRWFHGLDEFFEMLERGRYKMQYRIMLARYTGKTLCPACRGTRLRTEASYVRINGKNITELVTMSFERLQEFFRNLELTDYEKAVAGRTLTEINSRIDCMLNLGLGYLTLNRTSNTLSGGESRRINLSVSLGNSLVGSLYILDEPSIGLHPRDIAGLTKVLGDLRDTGNTVLVVEHEEAIMRAADEIIDIGPYAGSMGGKIVFQGKISDVEKGKTGKIDKSVTLQYLTGKEQIATPAIRRKLNQYIEITGAREHNLKNVNVKIPLNGIVAVTGVSGSGKSTLIRGILYPALMRNIISGADNRYIPGDFDKIAGDIHRIKYAEMVDQNPIGRSSRSNSVTYLKIYDDIRRLFASQKLAEQNGFGHSHFSFNISGGRCEDCQGDGFIEVEMQFMANIILECETCKGKRFKEDVLEVKYYDKNIYDVLELTVDDAVKFFGRRDTIVTEKIVRKLTVLQNVGLGYIKLGQSTDSLSGGETQRLKLAFSLLKEEQEETLFIFDEPTSGLHLHDIRKLMDSLNALVEKGHSVIVIEHNPEVIKCADRVIDLGPEGGDNGGYIIFEGTPEELVKCEKSYTGKYLRF
jgi:excinuclease ABC subunit A